MKIEIPAFIPMAKCNEHLAHGPISIDLGEDVVRVIRCKNCDMYIPELSVCIGVYGNAPLRRPPDFYCAQGKERRVSE